MTIDKIRKAVLKMGFHWREEPEFTGWIFLTQKKGRFLCAGKYMKRFGYTGALAWLQETEGRWYLGLLNNPLFHVGKPESLPELICGILSHQIPGILPQQIISDFALSNADEK